MQLHTFGIYLDKEDRLLVVNGANNKTKPRAFFPRAVLAARQHLTHLYKPGRYDTALAGDNALLEWWVEVRLDTLGQLKSRSGVRHLGN